MKAVKRLLLLLVAVCLVFMVGCGFVHYKSETAEFTSMRFGLDTSIENAEFVRTKDGNVEVKLGGYGSEAKVELLKAMLEKLP